MDCAGDEYYLHGECRKCQQCPPGQQLKEECGYGVGVSTAKGSTVCVQCEERWFKGEWGSHSCRMCQTCRRLNRQEITPCTRTHNAACGGCLPGYYSKRRLDGLQDLECLPCGSAPFRNAQCRSEEDHVGSVHSSDAPPHNAAVVMITCVAAVAMVTVLFVAMVLMYRGFSSLRNLFKGCLSPGSSLSDITASSVSAVTEHRVTPSAEAPDPCQSLTYPCSVSMEMTPTPCPHLSTACESVPLVRSSVCSDLTPGVVSQASVSSDAPPGPDWSVSTYDLASRGQHCAVEQESAWGHHAPVECSELDFINISLPLDLLDSTHSQSQFSSRVERERGMHLGHYPLYLVQSLAQKLDPMFPRVSNYQKVALQLEVPSDILSERQGFEHLFHFLSSTTLLTIPDLLQVLWKVQRVDVLLLLSEYATNVNMAIYPHTFTSLSY